MIGDFDKNTNKLQLPTKKVTDIDKEVNALIINVCETNKDDDSEFLIKYALKTLFCGCSTSILGAKSSDHQKL